MPPLTIRPARPSDAETVARLVRNLAQYERLEHEVISTPESFARILSDPAKKVEILLAEIDKQSVGFALFFENFSTFLGKPGLYLEDLFVEPEFRRSGIGSALFEELFQIARTRKYGRVEWNVLEWNEPAIKFYTEKLGAKLLEDWRVCRVLINTQ